MFASVRQTTIKFEGLVVQCCEYALENMSSEAPENK